MKTIFSAAPSRHMKTLLLIASIIITNICTAQHFRVTGDTTWLVDSAGNYSVKPITSKITMTVDAKAGTLVIENVSTGKMDVYKAANFSVHGQDINFTVQDESSGKKKYCRGFYSGFLKWMVLYPCDSGGVEMMLMVDVYENL